MTRFALALSFLLLPMTAIAQCVGDAPVVDARPFGVNPGALSVTSALNALLVTSAAAGQAVYLPAGRYTINAPIEMPTNAILVGDGDDTIIQGSIGDNDWVTARAMVEFVGTDDASLCNLYLDGRGTERTSAPKALSLIVLLSNANNNRLSEVTIYDAGYVGQPSGPALFLYSRMAGDPQYFAGFDLGEIGSTSGNIVEDSAFIQPATTAIGFAIRVYTDFTLERAPGAYTSVANGNQIHDTVFRGDYFWNTVEVAGGGSSATEVDRNTFAGHTLTHIDFDKGAHDNFARNNLIEYCGKPDFLYDLHLGIYQIAACIQDHGNSATYLNDANEISGNEIYAMNALRTTGDPAAITELMGAISVLLSTNAVISNNTIHSVHDGGRGAGIFINGDVSDVLVTQNRIGVDRPGAVKTGIRGGNQAEMHRVSITANTIESTLGAITTSNQALWMVGDPTDFEDWVITDNIVTTTNPSFSVIEVSLHTADLSRNTVTGGLSGFFLQALDSTITFNSVANAASWSYRLFNDATLTSNTASGPGSPVTPMTPHCLLSGGAVAIQSGNDFTCP